MPCVEGAKFVVKESRKEGLLDEATAILGSPSVWYMLVLLPTAYALVGTGAATKPIALGGIVPVLVTALERERRGPTLEELDDSLR